MSSTLMSPANSHKPAFAAAFGLGLVRLADSVVLTLAKQRSRMVLSQLDDRMLRDIGIDRATAAHEAGQPIWR
ncbi:MAG: DUF1127 domain-containing protein [Rhodospirillales bacterium]